MPFWRVGGRKRQNGHFGGLSPQRSEDLGSGNLPSNTFMGRRCYLCNFGSVGSLAAEEEARLKGQNGKFPLLARNRQFLKTPSSARFLLRSPLKLAKIVSNAQISPPPSGRSFAIFSIFRDFSWAGVCPTSGPSSSQKPKKVEKSQLFCWPPNTLKLILAPPWVTFGAN